MVAIGWTAWCAVTNSNPWTGSYWSPVQTRPRLLTGSRVLPGAGGPPGGADAVRRVPSSSARRCARPRQVPLASPSSGSLAPRARTGGPVLPASALSGPARRSAAGTPANTADGSSASWTFLSAPTMGCPRNRFNSRRYGFNSLRCDVQRASHRAFAEITQAGAGALTDLEGGVFWTERKRLVELAVKSRLPAVYARPLGGRLPSTQCPPKRGAE